MLVLVEDERSLLETLSEGTDTSLAFWTGGHSNWATELIITSSSSDEYDDFALTFDRNPGGDLRDWIEPEESEGIEDNDVMSRSYSDEWEGKEWGREWWVVLGSRMWLENLTLWYDRLSLEDCFKAVEVEREIGDHNESKTLPILTEKIKFMYG